jgi:hypothetical protein
MQVGSLLIMDSPVKHLIGELELLCEEIAELQDQGYIEEIKLVPQVQKMIEEIKDYYRKEK